MPTIQSSQIPKPKSWDEFETIVRDAMSQRWKSSTLAKNGRAGQKQNGVDIYGNDDLGRPVGIQCKCTKSEINYDIIEQEVLKAEKFKGRLVTLFIATTAEHDAKLQENIRAYSESRVMKGGFAVGILYWDEIIAGLVLNPEVFKAHYPQYGNFNTTPKNRKERKIAALELSFYGAQLWSHINLVHGEVGDLAQEDPDQILIILRIIQRRAHQLLPKEDAEPIILMAKQLSDFLPKAANDLDWKEIRLISNRISKRIVNSESCMPFKEGTFIRLGAELCHKYFRVDDLSETQKRHIKKMTVSILGEKCKKKVDIFCIKNKKINDYSWPLKMYRFISNYVRFG
ncbi:hypothetical protein [Rheinheimera sp.]|uniref:hypothetical protein n=1 Tax=Rheinheimera sp. TaxID=1869214 RepID=UPI00261187BF|nr:hypothetical protein [Rheinheimera sp.]MCA1931654.1 hypothetical protein [Rheinheimera sp.]